MSRGRRSRPRRTWPQRLVIALNVIIVFSALASAGVLAYTSETVSDIPRVAIGPTLNSNNSGLAAGSNQSADIGETPDSEILNFLLVGIDNVSGLPDDHILKQTRGLTELTDTMVIFRVDPSTGTASVMSIPRDLWVPINGGSPAKLNSALSLGGPEALVTSIQDALGIPIHRYVQVNFAGFLQLVDVLDGVDVIIDAPLADRKAQLDISQTGCVTLTPSQALAYVRSRNLYANLNGSWQLIDGTGDFGRIDRQQDFMIIAANQAFAKGLGDPTVLNGILKDVLGGEHVVLDTSITLQELIDFAQAFRSFEEDDITRYTLPASGGMVGEASVVFLHEDEAQEVLAAFRDPADNARFFNLLVENGTLSPGLAGEVQFLLQDVGFSVAGTGNADRADYAATTILFDSSQQLNALELERWLQSGAVLRQRESDTGEAVELILGEDWAGLLSVPREPTTLPEASSGELAAAGESGTEEVEITDTPTPTPVVPTPTPVPAFEALSSIRGC